MDKIVLYGLFSDHVIKLFKKELGNQFSVKVVDNPAGDYSELADAKYIVNRVFPMPEDLFHQCQELLMVQKWGAGYDKVDVAAAGALGIPVAACTGVNAVPVAELTVLLMLAVYRNILPLNRRFMNGEWARDEYSPRSFMLHGKNVGLLGFGRIGQEVGHILQKGFGAKVRYYDIRRMPEEKEMALGFRYVPLNQLLETSDIISVHVALVDATRKMVNREFFQKMKRSAILINTSRGGVIDEADLIQALQNGDIAGAGLDTFASEPLDKSSPLLHMDNVVATPHCGGNTADNDINMVDCCVRSILAFESGKFPQPPELVNGKFLHQ